MTTPNDTQARVSALSSLISQNTSRAAQDGLLEHTGAQTREERDQIQGVIDACQELSALLTEPHEWMADAAWAYVDSVALQLIIEMNIHNHVPCRPGVISLSELTEKTGGATHLVRRVMQQCVKRQIFNELEPQLYQHNARSACLLQDEFASLVHYLTDDGLLCGAHLTRCLSQRNFKPSTDPRYSAFQLAFNTDKTLYDYYDSVDPERGNRFGKAMAGHYNTALDEPIERMYSFDTLNPHAQVVDIGGGQGQHSIRLATKYPRMSFIVQDLPSVVDSAQATVEIPIAASGRVQWQTHNMYTPQPVCAADVYLLSHVLMDHQTSDCIQILRHIVNAMEPGKSRILIHDFTDPENGKSGSRLLNGLSFHMLASLNGNSRPIEDWTEIFSKADSRLSLNNVFRGPKETTVLELFLEGSR